jgi:8-hydroxy-5-deazaflavin:NADPH oxidoreductase
VLLEATTKNAASVAQTKEHHMAHLSIIGTGNMGQAIAAVAGRGGHTVQLLGQDDSATSVTGEIVVLAVPYPAVSAVIAERGDSLAGKVVVDITNPLNFETFDSLTVAADGSAAAEIAAALPQSKVLKAFNTNFAGTLAAGKVGSLDTTVLIAGDHADAKSELAGIVTSGGLEAIDAGSLARARELEAIGFLQITLAAGEKVAWTGGFGVVAA